MYLKVYKFIHIKKLLLAVQNIIRYNNDHSKVKEGCNILKNENTISVYLSLPEVSINGVLLINGHHCVWSYYEHDNKLTEYSMDRGTLENFRK